MKILNAILFKNLGLHDVQAKGQVISKANLLVQNSSKQNESETSVLVKFIFWKNRGQDNYLLKLTDL